MARQRPLEIGEQREIRSAPILNITKDDRVFATVTLEWFNAGPILLLVFGDVCQELEHVVARDFCARIARIMTTKVAPGAMRGVRPGKTLTREQRDRVAVMRIDDFTRTRLRLEFDDGNTVDFSEKTGADFADRIARAAAIIPEQIP